jgi:hypothetical protein
MAELPERLCAGSASFLADLAFVPNDVIESSDKESAMHPRQMRQERFFGRTRTIRFRVHPHPDFHRARPEPECSVLLGKERNTRVNANCHSWPDASVRPRRLFHRHYVGSKGKLTICESNPSDNSRLRSGAEDSTSSHPRLEPAERDYARQARRHPPPRVASPLSG